MRLEDLGELPVVIDAPAYQEQLLALGTDILAVAMIAAVMLAIIAGVQIVRAVW